MSEPIVFRPVTKTSLAEIVTWTGAAVAEGADLSVLIGGVAPLDEAGPGELTFMDSPENVLLLDKSRATACFIRPSDAPRLPKAILALVTEEPYHGFVLALQKMFPQTALPRSLLGTAGISPGASVHPEARIEQGVIVDPGAVIGPRAEIGLGSIIGANSVIGSDVRIGRDCLVGPQVTISHALIGDRVTLHPGARIGQSAIDFLHGRLAPQRRLPAVPEIGRVIIQDSVEVGANSTIDRGTAGDTIIGEATRIGNLARIAENVVIGRYCIIPAQAGLSAGARRADFTVFG